MPMDWTPPPRGGGHEKDLSQVLDEIKQRLPSFKRAKGLWIIAAVVIALILGSSAYYTVEPEETGLVLRFGRYDRQAGPGLHFKLPFGVESAIVIKTGRVFKEEFGFRGISPGVRSRFTQTGYANESLMLTGDLNVIEVKWIVQYKIRDPKLWLFAVRDGNSAIRDLSEAVMREIVGNRYGDEVLTLARVEIAAQAQKNLQRLLDSYNTGVQVVTVKLQDVNPPGPVQPAFNEVNEARQQKERMINEAEGYATERVNQAKGEAVRFEAVLAAYRKSQNVTKRRMYLEAMQKVLQKADRIYVVDKEVKGLLPLLDLNKRSSATTAKEVKP